MSNVPIQLTSRIRYNGYISNLDTELISMWALWRVESRPTSMVSYRMMDAIVDNIIHAGDNYGME